MTSRDVGLTISILTTMRSTLRLKVTISINTVPVQQLYRVALALFERTLVLAHIEGSAGLRVTEESRQPIVNDEFSSVLGSLLRLPRVLVLQLEQVGCFTISRAPTMQRDRYNNGAPQPDAGSIVLSNLFLVVEALANAATPVVVRRRFVGENPIPGAHFNNQWLLENADDVMPAGYRVEKLRSDVQTRSF